MKIGNLNLKKNVFLAPMAGVSDLAFRKICFDFGLEMAYTEMISAKALVYKDKVTYDMLKTDNTFKTAVQIFGKEPDIMAETARILTDMHRFSLIDINMGCPAPKITKNGEGSALIKTPKLAGKIVRAVKNATDLPVTVKMRTGFCDDTEATKFTKILQENGADAITVHGRTREQFYGGKADWDLIAEIKEQSHVPVIGNGDVTDLTDALNKISLYKVDGVLIGRAARGNPFIFAGEDKNKISGEKFMHTIFKHYALEIEYKGEDRAVKEMRKHIGWYIKGMEGSAKMRNLINCAANYAEVRKLLCEYFHKCNTV